MQQLLVSLDLQSRPLPELQWLLTSRSLCCQAYLLGHKVSARSKESLPKLVGMIFMCGFSIVSHLAFWFVPSFKDKYLFRSFREHYSKCHWSLFFLLTALAAKTSLLKWFVCIYWATKSAVFVSCRNTFRLKHSGEMQSVCFVWAFPFVSSGFLLWYGKAFFSCLNWTMTLFWIGFFLPSAELKVFK